jgi:hypothetical protein
MGLRLFYCPLNWRGRYKKEDRLVSGDLSEDEESLLSQLKARGGYVTDKDLLEATEIDPKEYDDAALGLIKKKYAETHVGISDPSSLKATPRGIRRAREL